MDGFNEDEIVVVVVVSATLKLEANASKATRHAIFFIRVLSPQSETLSQYPKIKSLPRRTPQI